MHRHFSLLVAFRVGLVYMHCILAANKVYLQHSCRAVNCRTDQIGVAAAAPPSLLPGVDIFYIFLLRAIQSTHPPRAAQSAVFFCFCSGGGGGGERSRFVFPPIGNNETKIATTLSSGSCFFCCSCSDDHESRAWKPFHKVSFSHSATCTTHPTIVTC
jgi:hypothetical protein